MGEWVIGAFINFFGSIVINFGTNLLKLGHNERERLAMLDSDGINGKLVLKPIIQFQTWRLGFLFFALGNCLNFISFGYAAQSLLAALGSIQFVSNIAFTYFVFKKTVSVSWSLQLLLFLATSSLLLLAIISRLVWTYHSQLNMLLAQHNAWQDTIGGILYGCNWSGFPRRIIFQACHMNQGLCESLLDVAHFSC